MAQGIECLPRRLGTVEVKWADQHARLLIVGVASFYVLLSIGLAAYLYLNDLP